MCFSLILCVCMHVYDDTIGKNKDSQYIQPHIHLYSNCHTNHLVGLILLYLFHVFALCIQLYYYYCHKINVIIDAALKMY